MSILLLQVLVRSKLLITQSSDLSYASALPLLGLLRGFEVVEVAMPEDIFARLRTVAPK